VWHVPESKIIHSSNYTVKTFQNWKQIKWETFLGHFSSAHVKRLENKILIFNFMPKHGKTFEF
jgi:hypothetical protein